MNRSVLLAFAVVAATENGLAAVAEPVIEVSFAADASPELRVVADRWVARAKGAVIAYYGGFIVDRLRIKITPRAGRRARNGVASGWNGPLITVSLGRDTTDADLANDWLLTHEMLHLGFPSLPRRHHWLEEGISTYVEPIARVRAGQMTPERAWLDLVEGLPQGQPEAGDRGLDGTHTWGRTYWGGALFCLRADIEIRKRTRNAKGLEHALGAIRAAGGTIEVEWPIERAIAIGDQATGVPVLRELYDEMKDAPVTVPIDEVWIQLGIKHGDGKVTFDDAAPLAKIRQAITKR
jgi:hypothetical protein